MSPEGKCRSTSHEKGICNVHFPLRATERVRCSETSNGSSSFHQRDTWKANYISAVLSTSLGNSSGLRFSFYSDAMNKQLPRFGNTARGKATLSRSRATSAATLSRSSVLGKCVSPDPMNFVILYFLKMVKLFVILCIPTATVALCWRAVQ